MRLATRTGLASFVAASITLLAVGALFRGYFATVLQERVDTQLEERAETAPILAAVADRLSQSELRTTLEGARVVRGGETISLGLLPADPLPDEIVPGWSTARASGDRWRLYTVEVYDVPEARRQGVGATRRSAGRCRRAGDPTSPPRHLRDGADLTGRRSRRLPPRQGRHQAADCAAP